MNDLQPNDVKSKIVNFVKFYLSYFAVTIICIIFLTIDLIKLEKNDNYVVALGKTALYIVMAITITTLLRYQGIIHGKSDEDVIKTLQEYDVAITNNQSETDRLDEWCEEKNEMRRISEVKKHLKYAHLSYEKWCNGEYEMPSEKHALKRFKAQFSKRQLKCIAWINSCVVELYNAEYLTSEMERESKKAIAHNVSVNGYLTKKSGTKVISSVVTSFAFGFLTVSLAKDISFANFFYSAIKVASWVGSGMLALFSSYIYITSTYKDAVKDKIRKLNEFNTWCKEHPKKTEEVKLACDVGLELLTNNI